MAGGQERVLRRRIKSVQSTRKITKAMELIAASQIPRSLARIIANRPYRVGMQRIVLEAALADPAGAKRLLAMPEKVDTALVLVVTGDRGLSGPYNNASLRAGERLVEKLQREGTQVRLYCVGKKAAAFFATAVLVSRRTSLASWTDRRSPTRRSLLVISRLPI